MLERGRAAERACELRFEFSDPVCRAAEQQFGEAGREGLFFFLVVHVDSVAFANPPRIRRRLSLGCEKSESRLCRQPSHLLRHLAQLAPHLVGGHQLRQSA